MLKMLLFKRAMISSTKKYEKKLNNLPIYSVLIPLYQETEKTESIIDSILKLNYPQSLLDVKIIVEEDDFELIDYLREVQLPYFIQLIIVPFCLPRTKPKALNYTLPYCKGKYLVVYDAEDKPDENQLLDAIAAFEALPAEYVCMQAKLNFYNKEENILTRLFSVEYSLWFNYLLKGLSLLNFPVPLGGTSNHFKTNILRKVGAWDAYNVTEDADLGIRLYLNGYKVNIIDSITLEESPITITNWLKQRSRWIKGFIQTFLVFLKQKPDFSKVNYLQLASIYLFMGISSYSFFCIPWAILTVWDESFWAINYLWLINSFFTFSYFYAVAFWILYQTPKLNILSYLVLVIWPFYFLLHIIASYIALVETIITPFVWNKTKHGQSKFKN